MDSLTEEGVVTGTETAPGGASLMLQLSDGTYILIPEVAQFIKDNKGTALMIDDDYDIHVLKAGLKKNQYRWVSIVDDVAQT